MARFLFLYRGGIDAFARMSPVEMQQQLKRYRDWIDEGVREGWLHDVGDGLGEGCIVNAVKVVTDGPFVESKELIGGYQIVNAESLEAAVDLAKRCPNLLVGGSVEVRPLAGHAQRY